MSRFPSRTLSLRVAKKKRRGTLLCFTKSLVSKNSRKGERGGEGGSITTFRQKFFSQVIDKFRRGTLLFFKKFLVSKNFRDRREGRVGRE